MSSSAPPLTGIRVLEFAGLAPGPFAGMLLADYGATVLRLDRAIPGLTHPSSASAPTAAPTPDFLSRRKTSVAIDLKSRGGVALVKSLIPHVDVVIDPFRPGVLEKLGLCPTSVMLKLNPRLVVGRMTGFRRDGKYAQMAGHDINYIAVSGTLSMLGRAGDRPYAPGNIVADFAGGGLMCFMGVVMALLAREKNGRGQVVEANMVDGSAILTTMPRLAAKTMMWDRERGENTLDGGSPFYDTYETKDGKYMAVGALEPQFYAALLKGLQLESASLGGSQLDRSTWQRQRDAFARAFKAKTRKEWEDVFDGTDACCTPVLTQDELEAQGFQQRPAVTLRSTPGLALADEKEKLDVAAVRGQGLGVEGEGWSTGGLVPGHGGEETLGRWMGWKRGGGYEVENGGLVKPDAARL